jgi:hypothetical protein
VHLLEELVTVSVVYPNPNQDRAGDLKRLLQRWPDLIRDVRTYAPMRHQGSTVALPAGVT